MEKSQAAPLLSPAGLALALIAALMLGWPMLATGSYLIFADTVSYIRGGEIIWDMMRDMLGSANTGTDSAAGNGAAGNGGAGEGPGSGMRSSDGGKPYVVRSFIYSFYTLITGAAIWPAGFAILQSALTLWMLLALIGPTAASRPWVLACGFVYLAALTSLPWFTAYLMPDMLAAAVLIYGAILMGRFDILSLWQRLGVGAIAACAIAAHYGHGPLAAGLFGTVLIWRLVTRRLTLAVTVAAILPILFSPLANLGASSVALDKPSVVPLRLPVLLARSIQDGPARWYLEEACPEAPLAFCEAFGEEVPGNIRDFLWDDGGINSLTPRLLARIRTEEFEVLARAFRAYPVAQSVSLSRNAALQIVRIGTGQITPGARGEDGMLENAPSARARSVLNTFDDIVPWATGLGALALLMLVLSGRLTREEIGILVAISAGILLNALIFGGLSAPVDRYQSRIAWLIPALAFIFLAGISGRAGRRAEG